MTHFWIFKKNQQSILLKVFQELIYLQFAIKLVSLLHYALFVLDSRIIMRLLEGYLIGILKQYRQKGQGLKPGLTGGVSAAHAYQAAAPAPAAVLVEPLNPW
jgi:hypothetical protein